MKISEYSESDRFNSIRGSVMLHEEMIGKVLRGDIESINRTKAEILKNKMDKGGLTASSWYLKGDIRCVVSCQPSPGGILVKKISEVINGDIGRKRILVMED